MRSFLSFATVAVGMTSSTVALADEPIFGKAGQLAISSDGNLQLASTSLTQGGGTTTTLTLLPAFDYFVIDNLSVGGFVLVQYVSESTSDGGVTTFGIGPRIGYDFTLNDAFSFWPKVSLGFQHASAAGDDSTSFTLAIYAPLLIHPAPHFFLGLGPIFSTDLVNTDSYDGGSGTAPKATTFGLAFTVGGWVGL